MKNIVLDKKTYYTINKDQTDKEYWYHLDLDCGHYESIQKVAADMFHTHTSMKNIYTTLNHGDQSPENQRYLSHFYKVRERYLRFVTRHIIVHGAPNKDKVRKINNILRDKWNPIGFHDSLPKDEYVRYAKELAKMLEVNADVLSVAFYLRHVENDIIGLKPKTLYWQLKRFIKIISVSLDILKLNENNKSLYEEASPEDFEKEGNP